MVYYRSPGEAVQRNVTLLGAQSLMSASQVSPVYPALQEHTKPPIVLVHVPRFLQGFVIHSFTSTLHN